MKRKNICLSTISLQFLAPFVNFRSFFRIADVVGGGGVCLDQGPMPPPTPPHCHTTPGP